MSNSPLPKICGSTYPVSRNMLEYYLTQQGYSAIALEVNEENEADVYSVYAKEGSAPVEIHHGNIFDRPAIRSLLESNNLSLDDFESFVNNLKMTEEAFNKIIDDCIDVPENIIYSAKEWQGKK